MSHGPAIFAEDDELLEDTDTALHHNVDIIRLITLAKNVLSRLESLAQTGIACLRTS